MVYLSKDTKPLLRMVNNKQHATDHDHEADDQKKQPKVLKDIDVDREPESSDEDDSQLGKWQPPPNRKVIRPPPRTRKVVDDKKQSPQKRQHDSEDEREKIVFAGSQEQQRPKKQPKKTFSKKVSSQSSQSSSQPTTAQKGETNPHSPSSTNNQISDSPGQIRKPNIPPAAKSDIKSKAGIKAPPSGASAPTSSQSESTRIFRRPAGFTDPPTVPNSTGTSTSSQAPLSPNLCPSSPLSSIDEYELHDLDETTPKKQDDTISRKAPCPICGEQVDKSFHRTFQADIARGKRLNLRLQEKFCIAHKARNATTDWKDRGYPTIDWTNLHDRLKAHHDHLRAVLDGTFESPFRKKLEEQLKNTRGNTVAQSLSDHTTLLRAGYYGTKGEKIMAEHIVRAFSRRLRTLAASDKLMASKGVSGGVSGYVHGVLVPELAVGLIMEDMGCVRDRALEVMEVSADLGELLNEEEDENVPRIELGVDGEDEDGDDGGGGGGFRRPSIVID